MEQIKFLASPVMYKTKSKNAQEAHEAIRPTSVQRTPEAMKQYLNADQHKLYSMIWKRTIASQMIPATIKYRGGRLFPVEKAMSFEQPVLPLSTLALWLFTRKGRMMAVKKMMRKIWPAFAKGDQVDVLEMRAEQHFTKPPPRYSEASLIKSLEEFGIGRPSTYASIIATLQSREYAILESRRFFPTDLGRVVNSFLTNHFEQYVDYEFTASLEDNLDSVSRGESEWEATDARILGSFLSTN